jgi:hypothetical protein
MFASSDDWLKGKSAVPVARRKVSRRGRVLQKYSTTPAFFSHLLAREARNRLKATP